jgi:hypothetical protein
MVDLLVKTCLDQLLFILTILFTFSQNKLTKSGGQLYRALPTSWYSLSERIQNLQSMEECALKNVNICLNTNIYSYLEAFGGQSPNLHLNVVHFYNTSVN